MSTSNPSRRRPSSGARRGPPRKTAGSGSKTKIEPLHPTDIPPDIHSFTEWNLGDDIQGAIAKMGITVPSPIQKLAIGPCLEGRDVIAKAETGTGKTLAFGAPIMAKIDPARASVLALVLCPTRELAEQVSKVLAQLGEPRNIKVALIVGGEPLGPQVAALKSGSQVVVGTPGRVLDLYNQKFLSFPWTEFAVLDEADVMLEIGFIDDVKMILSFIPDERQTLLFSATFPPELLKLAREYTKNPAEVATAAGIATVTTIDQSWMKVDDEDRPLALTRLIEQSEPDDVFLVFCDRRTDVDRLMRRLERLPFSLKALHGGYDQEARFRVMSAFRTGEVKALVATDVASRGLDVAHVTHVINFGAPADITDYTHRIGRTGRAGRKGRAMTFVTRPGMVRWERILKDANWDIAEVEPPGPSRGGSRAPRPAAREERRDEAPERAPRPDRTHTERKPAERVHPPREAAPRSATVRESAPREAAPRERAPREPAARSHRSPHAPREPEPTPTPTAESARTQRPTTRDEPPPVREPLRQSEVLHERERMRERSERPAHRAPTERAPRERAGHEPRSPRAPHRAAEHRAPAERRAPAEHRTPAPHRAPAEPRVREEHRAPRAPTARDAAPTARDAAPTRRDARTDDKPHAPARSAHPPRDSKPRAPDHEKPARAPRSAPEAHPSDRPARKEAAREPRPHTRAPHSRPPRTDFGDGL